MKTIELTRGYVALVDDEDYEELNKFKWYAHGSKRISAARRLSTNDAQSRKLIHMHRVVMGDPEGMVVDHISGDPLDNRKQNLRACSFKQNIWNTRAMERKNALPKGVYKGREGAKNPFIAKFGEFGTRIYLGVFPTVDEAKAAYEKKALEVRGQYHRS